MYNNRQPIRGIRNESLDNKDRFAEFHEQRVNADHDLRTDENYPLAVIHIAPKLAFSNAATRFTVPDLLERDIRLHIGSSRPSRPNMAAGRLVCSTDPAPHRNRGGRRVSLYENTVVEILTARETYEKKNDQIISHNSLVDAITGNLAVVLSLLAERQMDQKVLVTATFLGFDGTKFKQDFPTESITNDYIQTPVLSFSGYNAKNDEDDSTYDLRTEYVKELFRPLFHSAGRQDFPMDIPDTLKLPDLSLDNS